MQTLGRAPPALLHGCLLAPGRRKAAADLPAQFASGPSDDIANRCCETPHGQCACPTICCKDMCMPLLPYHATSVCKSCNYPSLLEKKLAKRNFSLRSGCDLNHYGKWAQSLCSIYAEHNKGKEPKRDEV